MNALKRYRVLIIAIGASLAWHLFWISAVRIETSKAPARSVRFGKVSFLGPMSLGRGMELKLSPKQWSFLEKRYLARLDRMSSDGISGTQSGYLAYDPRSPAEETMSGLIAGAVGGSKAEPDNTI